MISVLYCDGKKIGHDQARVLLLLHPKAHPAAATAAEKKEDRVRTEK